MIDFAYTGDFERPAPAGDTELATLLNDLLELLPIADEWDIPQLKHLLEHKIIHKYDMIQKLPHQCQISKFFMNMRSRFTASIDVAL